MPTRIRIVAPVADHSAEADAAIASDLERLKVLEVAHGVELEHVRLQTRPTSIRSHDDEVQATPATLELILQAQRDGVDAVVVDCTSDVAVLEARERVTIPVIGPGEACRHIASSLGIFAWLDDLASDPIPRGLEAARMGAKAIVLGGTGWSHIADKLHAALAEQGLEAAVLDPLRVAVAEAIRLVQDR